jgi:hypothetical protein
MEGKVSGKDKSGAVLVAPKFLPETAKIISHDEAVNYEKSGKTTAMKDAKKSRKAVKNNDPDISDTGTKTTKLFVRIVDSSNADALVKLKQTIELKNGDVEVVLVLGENEDKQIIRLPHKVTIDEETVRDIAEIVGAQNVIAQ